MTITDRTVVAIAACAAPSEIVKTGDFEAVVTDALSDMAEQDEAIPVPFSERTYSGMFNVRIGEGLHRDLVVPVVRTGVHVHPVHP